MPLGVEAVTRALIKRAQRGLYAGRQKLFGNKISEDGGNKCEPIAGRAVCRVTHVPGPRALVCNAPAAAVCHAPFCHVPTV